MKMAKNERCVECGRRYPNENILVASIFTFLIVAFILATFAMWVSDNRRDYAAPVIELSE